MRRYHAVVFRVLYMSNLLVYLDCIVSVLEAQVGRRQLMLPKC